MAMIHLPGSVPAAFGTAAPGRDANGVPSGGQGAPLSRRGRGFRRAQLAEPTPSHSEKDGGTNDKEQEHLKVPLEKSWRGRGRDITVRCGKARFFVIQSVELLFRVFSFLYP